MHLCCQVNTVIKAFGNLHPSYAQVNMQMLVTTAGRERLSVGDGSLLHILLENIAQTKPTIQMNFKRHAYVACDILLNYICMIFAAACKIKKPSLKSHRTCSALWHLL